jgi:hypothetical protein
MVNGGGWWWKVQLVCNDESSGMEFESTLSRKNKVKATLPILEYARRHGGLQEKS